MDRAGAQPQRFASGVPGLDEVLQGGLIRNSSYLIAGGPGTGKTVLGSQVAFHLAQRGESTCFVSVLTEPYSMLLRNLSSFDFFREEFINQRIQFISGYSTLEAEGLSGLENVLRLTLRKSKASLLILDSIGTLGSFSSSDHGYRAYLGKIVALCSMAGATLLASTDKERAACQSEFGAFDGVIELRRSRAGMRTTRVVEILKSRGSPHLDGEHFFEIERSGLEVFPRFEVSSQDLPRSRSLAPGERDPFGIQRLDQMLVGGVPRGSATGLVGASGVGKTLLGLSFLDAGARRGERGVYFGFHESPELLVQAGEGIGLELRAGVESGLLSFEWRPEGELLLDKLGGEIVEIAERMRPHRLFFDSIDGLRLASAHPDRVPGFLAVLTNLLRSRAITTIMTEETPLLGPDILPSHTLSPSFETLILLRYVEIHSELRRVLSVLKSKGIHQDPSLREFLIGREGISVSLAFAAAEGILGGLARAGDLQRVIVPEQGAGEPV